MRVIAIVNQKGGSGKTTTAINLAAIYAHRGYRTLLVDLDSQSHCAVGLGVPERQLDCTIDAALLADLDSFDPDPLLWEVSRNLHLAPSTMRLATLEAPGGGLHELSDKDRRVEKLLKSMEGRFDRCLIDCPPTIGLLTFNGLRAAREALIPVETGFFALRGAEKQWQTIQRLIAHINRPIACHLLPTLHNPDSQLSCDILHALQRQFAGQLVPAVIEYHESLKEAVSMGQPIMEYAPDSPAHRQFEALVDWLEKHQARPIAEIEVMANLGMSAGLMSARHASPSAPSINTTTGSGSEAGGASNDGGEPQGRAAELVNRINDLTRRSAELEESPIPDSREIVGTKSAATTEALSDVIPSQTISQTTPEARKLKSRPPHIRPRAISPDQSSGGSPEEMPLEAVRTLDRPDENVPPPQTSPPASICPRKTPTPLPSPDIVDVDIEAPHQPTAAMKVSARFGIRPTHRGVLFVQPGDLGKSVAIAGDFNHWSPSASPMHRSESSGNFEALLDIPVGTWLYRLIVDGRWQADDYNDQRQNNAHQEPNSVLVVEAASEDTLS